MFPLPPSGLAHRGAALLFVNNGFRPCNKMMNASGALVPSVIVEISHLNGFAYGINKVRIKITPYLVAPRISVDICDTQYLGLTGAAFSASSGGPACICGDFQLHNKATCLFIADIRTGIWALQRVKSCMNIPYHLIHRCTAQVGIAQVGTAQVGIAQVGIAQVGTAQVGIAQVGIAQVGTAQVGTAQVGIAQVGTAAALSI